MCKTESMKQNVKLVLIFILITTLCFVSGVEKKKWLNYILLWTDSRVKSTFTTTLGQQQDVFIKKECPFQNCIVTKNKKYLNDITDFDAILFLGSELANLSSVPHARAEYQKYVFVSRDPASVYPVTSEYDSFFNWTWTYKLNSDIQSKYFVIKNKDGTIVGPKQEMHWMNFRDMKPISPLIKSKLLKKKTAAIWFASHYTTFSDYEPFVLTLRKELFQYNMKLRICGKCGLYNACPIKNMNNCLIPSRKKYYFSLAFEDSLCEDYVTRMLLHALQHLTVPIVLGGANYSRFLPENSYLDAREYTPRELAKIMSTIINDKETYFDYFRWHKYYSFHDIYDSTDTDDYCTFCNLLNDEEKKKKRSVYTNFVQWWNAPSDWPREWFDGRQLPEPVSTFKVVHDYKHRKQPKTLIQIPQVLLSRSSQVVKENKTNIVLSWFKKMYNLI